jgi:TrmH family RNA methyltransferase
VKAVTSRDNALFKRLKALATSTQQQKRSGTALLEGLHLAAAYLDAARPGQLQNCIVTEAALAHPETHGIVARVDAARVAIFSEPLFSQISTVVNGVGIVLLVDTPQPSWPERITSSCVILDGVQDAGNVGSILRSAAAVGIGHVFCAPGTAHAWSSKVVRSGMGAHFLLQVHEHVDAARLRARLDIPVAITDSHGAAAIYDVDLGGPVAWVFGNEGAGVSDAWRAAVTYRVTIPQPGGMESLNVAAAAAVCLFEQCRQQRAK